MNTTLPPPSQSLNMNSIHSSNAMNVINVSSLSSSVDTSSNHVSTIASTPSITPTITSTPTISFKHTSATDKPKVKPKRKMKATEHKKLVNQLNGSNLLTNDILTLFNNQLNGTQLGGQFASQLSNQLNSRLLSNQFGNQLGNQFNSQFGGQFVGGQFNGQLTNALNVNHSNGGLINNQDSRLQSHQTVNTPDLRPNKSKPMMNNESIIDKSSAINHLNQQLNNGCGPQQSINDNSNSNYHNIKDDKDNCKQVLCDQNGFVLSEIIYRCRICMAIHEYQADAKQHYHIKHMGGVECAPNFSNLSNFANLTNLRDLATSGLNGLSMINGLNGMGSSLVGHNFNSNAKNTSNNLSHNSDISNNTSSKQQANNLQLNLQNGLNSLSLMSNNSIENLYNDESTNNSNMNTSDAIDDLKNAQPMSGFLDTLNNCNKHNLSNLNLNSKQMTALSMYANGTLNSTNNNSLFQANLNQLNPLSQSPFCMGNFYSTGLSNDQQLMNVGLVDDEGFYSNNSSLINNGSVDVMRSTSKSGRAAESCTKSGFITCPVCGQCRYYTTLQRRYGQFTCVACYRFFKEFFNKPTIYICPTLTKCRLKCKQRCKACWISSCINLYTVDSKRQEILMKFKPRNSIDEIEEGEADAQLAILENLDMNDQSLSNTNNNTPTSMLNEDDLDEDEAGNSIEDDSFPLDFSSKKLMEIEQTNGAAEKNRFNKLNNRIECDIVCKVEPTVSEISNDQQSNNNTLTSNELREEEAELDELRIDELRADEPGFETRSEENSFTAQDSHQLSQFTTSLHNFMQFGKLSQQDQLTDWNNNSVPDSNQIFDNLNNNNFAKLSNGFSNDLNALNLSVNHENGDGSPVKKRSKNWSCLKCENCLAEDCGECKNCLDETKKRCEKKVCLETTSMVNV